MKYEIFDTMSKQQETLMATVQKLNQLAVAKVEKLTALQMNALRGYSDLSIQNLKELVEINNPQALQAYLGKQNESVKSVGEKLVADAKAVAEVGVEYSQEAQKITQDSFQASTKKAA